MGTYNVHAGHCPQGKGASGAVGLLQESVEDRKVKNRVISALKNNGHIVYDCTCEEKTTKNGCLKKIVKKCNAHNVDLDVSIHLNAGGGSGVEVWCYDSKTAAIASQICVNVSNALGIPNRGVKYKSLYVLKHTKAPALLVECCFVDSQNDYRKWNADKCGDAIASAIAGKTVQGSTSSGNSTVKPSKPSSSTQTPSKKEPALGMGDRGSDVKELQKLLIAKGYSCGSCGSDGIFGSGTKKAVIAFQKANGLVADGLAGRRTIEKLKRQSVSSSNWIARLQSECNNQGFSNQKVDGIAGKNTLTGCPTLRSGAKGKITKLLQERLISLGCSCGNSGADGVFGSGTKKAVIKFQKSKGLSADGIVGRNTWRELLGL